MSSWFPRLAGARYQNVADVLGQGSQSGHREGGLRH